MKHRIAALTLAVSLFALPAMAADNDAVMSRIDKIERDTMVLQRQIARSGSSSAGAVSPELDTTGAAQLAVRLSAMEEEMRNLRGKVEESEFQARRANESLEKLQKDVEFRFSQLSEQQAASAAAAAAAPATAAAVTPATDKPAATDNSLPTKDVPKEAAKPAEAAAPAEAAPTSFATARDHYNYAFRLLNQNKYEEAAASFKEFAKKYPKDPLMGNAHYWLGETHYIRHDYTNAADGFRAGFEAAPTGPKAADNLLKLAMSLNALKRDKEACVVLKQVVIKFAQTSANVAKKAQTEQKRIGCQ